MKILNYEEWRAQIVSNNQAIVNDCLYCNDNAMANCEDCNGSGDSYCDCCENDNPCKTCDETGRTNCSICGEKLHLSEKDHAKQVKHDFNLISGKCDSCAVTYTNSCFYCATHKACRHKPKKEA